MLDSTFDKMLDANKDKDREGYAFSCSANLKTDITEYKGCPVYFFNFKEDDMIYFAPTPFTAEEIC